MTSSLDVKELFMLQEHSQICPMIEHGSVQMAFKQRKPELDYLRAHYQLIKAFAAIHRTFMSYLFIKYCSTKEKIINLWTKMCAEEKKREC